MSVACSTRQWEMALISVKQFQISNVTLPVCYPTRGFTTPAMQVRWLDLIARRADGIAGAAPSVRGQQ
jgi:hypothetical protein